MFSKTFNFLLIVEYSLLIGGFGVLFATSQVAGQVDPPVFIENDVEPGKDGCVDLDQKCSLWASQGECQSNAAWMTGNCRRSCQSCQGGSRAWKLRSFISAHYDNATTTLSSKGNNSSSIHTVELDSLRLDHVSINEELQTMKVHGKLVSSWTDPRLKWNKAKWGLSWLNIYWIKVWTPKIIQTNAPAMVESTIDKQVLAANYTGKVYMWSDMALTAPCEFDYSDFPSDRQRCCFKLDEKKYYSVKFKVGPTATLTAKESIGLAHSSGWIVEDVQIRENNYNVRVLSEWSQDPYAVETSNCDICLTVKRNRAYFSSEIVLPALATALVTLASFFVGSFWNQILLLLASLGLQLISMCIISSQLPPATGSAPSILKFSGFNMGFTVVLLLLTILLLNLSVSDGLFPPPHFLQLIINVMEKAVPCMRIKVNDELRLGDPTAVETSHQSDEKGGNKDTSCPSSSSTKSGRGYPWHPAAKALKFSLFILTLVLYIFVTLACFL